MDKQCASYVGCITQEKHVCIQKLATVGRVAVLLRFNRTRHAAILRTCRA